MFGCIDNTDEGKGQVHLMDIEEFVNIDKIDMSNVKDASFMFAGCEWAKVIDNKIPANLEYVEDATAMLFYTSVSNYQERKGFSNEVMGNFISNLKSATNLSYAFGKNYLLESFDGLALEISDETAIDHMLMNDKFLKKVDIYTWKIFPDEAKYTEGWLNNVGASLPEGEKVELECDSIIKDAVYNSISEDQRGRCAIESPAAWWGISSDGTTLYLSAQETVDAKEHDNSILRGYHSDLIRPWQEYKDSIKSVVLESNSSNHKLKFSSTSRLFSNLINCGSIIGFENTDFSKCQSTDYMFYSCNNLTKLDLTTLNTSNVESMKQMFDSCIKLEILKLNFDTSNVVNMYKLFFNCVALSELDLSSFSNKSLISIRQMFAKCGNLTKIKADKSLWKSDHVYRISTDVFVSCQKLVGHSVTEHYNIWNEKIVDGTRARVDVDDDTPGYFTDKGYHP